MVLRLKHRTRRQELWVLIPAMPPGLRLFVPHPETGPIFKDVAWLKFLLFVKDTEILRQKVLKKDKGLSVVNKC